VNTIEGLLLAEEKQVGLLPTSAQLVNDCNLKATLDRAELEPDSCCYVATVAIREW